MTAPLTVLLVEDDNECRDFLSDFLKHIKYAVIEARSTDEALNQFEAYKDNINVILTNVNLGKETSETFHRKVANRLTNSRGPIKVIAMNGGCRTSELKYFRELPLTLLNKPFRLDELEALIQQPA